MGFLGKIEEGYQGFRQGQIDRRKKNLNFLKQKADLAAKEQQYNAVINKAKTEKMNSFNARMDAFAGALTGSQGKQNNNAQSQNGYSGQNSMDALMGVVTGSPRKPAMQKKRKQNASNNRSPRVIILR